MTARDFVDSYPLRRISAINIIDIKPESEIESNHKGKIAGTHTVRNFSYELADNIYLKWNYCMGCNRPRNQFIIAYIDSENAAYIRDIIVDGQFVGRDISRDDVTTPAPAPALPTKDQEIAELPY